MESGKTIWRGVIASNFAVAAGFPQELLPPHTGIIIADAFGGEILRDDPRLPGDCRLAPARRRTLTLRCARLAAERLQRLFDPQAPLAFDV